MKVSIYREDVRQPERTHRGNTCAIGERQVFVAILKEQIAGTVEPAALDAFPPQPRTSVNLLPPGAGRIDPQPKPYQRQGFVDHEIRGDEYLNCLERIITCRAACEMGAVALTLSLCEVDFLRAISSESS